MKKSKILKENHDIPIAGHLGASRMYNRKKERYYWRGIKSDIDNYVKHCSLCQTNKALRQTNRAPTQITTSSTRPFDRISIDVVGPLPDAGTINLRFILTIQDDLTKYSMALTLCLTLQQKTPVNA